MKLLAIQIALFNRLIFRKLKAEIAAERGLSLPGKGKSFCLFDRVILFKNTLAKEAIQQAP